MKNKQKGFIVPLLIIIIAVLAIGTGVYVYHSKQEKSAQEGLTENSNVNASTTSQVSSSQTSATSSTIKKIVSSVTNLVSGNSGSAPIVIKDSGSTNTGPFTITINSDGGGTKDFKGDINTKASLTQYPKGTFDYKALIQAITQVPSLQFSTACAKSASFGTTQTLTYKGQTSGDITCMPSGQAYSNLSVSIGKAENEAECFDPNNTSGRCQDFKAQQTATIDSGIIASVSVSPILGCQQSAQDKQKGYNPCGVGSFQATFSISKSDGTFVQKVSTDKNSQFTADLPPGNYVLTDMSAGTSGTAHPFFDANADYHGTLGSVANAKLSYNISIPAHVFVHIDPWFDGNSF